MYHNAGATHSRNHTTSTNKFAKQSLILTKLIIMKKTYSSNSRWGLKALSAAALALAFTVSASAQDYRKSWNFTKWSSETVANLKAANAVGGNAETREWSDVEKSGNSTPTDTSKDNVFWNWKPDVSGGSTSADNNITANGVVIAELEGLHYTNTGTGSLAIAVDYPTALNDYEGPAYLWLGGSNKNYFVIPHVAPGTEIKIGVESHKNSDARGIDLYVGRGNSGTKLLDPDGNAVALPTTYQDLVWLVPEGLADTPNEDGTYDIQIRNTNGCHLYYITVGDGDEGGAEEDKKIAVVSPEGEDDPLYFAVQEGFETTFISDAADATLEKLQEYEAILVSNKVAAGTALADALKSAVAYQPMVNLNAALIEAWGMGTVANTESNTISISEANLEDALFADLTYDEGLELVAEGTLPVVTPGAYLANDDVLATVGEAAYILVHNANRNAHILIPFAAEAATDGENMMGLVANALKVAAKSKKAVTNASAPTFSAVQGNLETTVTISGAGVIRYALGADAEVNETSAIYTEPIRFTEATMIKAYAVQDGYLPSAVATYEVAIAAKAEKPVITVTPGEGKSAVITFEAQEGAEVHFSFAGQAESSRLDKALTEIYTEPVVVTEPTVVYAFAIGEGLLASDLEEMSVDIPGVDASNIRLDIVSHLTGGNAWRSPKLDGVAIEGAPIAANVYMGNHKSDGTFGVSANNNKPWTHYSEEIDHTEEVQEQAKDEDGNLKFEADGVTPVMETVTKTYYKVDPNAYHELTCDEEPDWKLVSEGQCMIFETGLGANSYFFDMSRYPDGKPVGVVSATDLVSLSPTNGALSWKGKNSGEPYNGRIESTVAFDAPFDIVLFTRNAASNGQAYTGKVMTSTDGKEWKELQEVSSGLYQRIINRHRMSVEGEGKYYVRFEHNGQNLQLHDIYILNNGELSKEYTGLEEIADEAAEVISVEFFNINGMRIAEPENGFCIMRATLSNGNVVVKKIVK